MSKTDELRSRMGLGASQPNPNANKQQQDGNEDGGEGGNEGDGEGGSDPDPDPNANPNPGAPDPQPQPQPQGLTQEQLLAELQKVNPSIKSLDDLKPQPTKEDEEVVRKRKQADMVAWAMQANKVDKDTYDRFQIDSAKDPRQVVFEAYAEKHKDKDPERVRQMFARLYHENLDPDNDDEAVELIAEAQEKMKVEAARLLKKKYATMYSLEREYDSHTSQQKAATDRNNRIQTNYQTYMADLTSILAEAKGRDFTIGDQTNPFTKHFAYKPEVIAKIKQEFEQKDRIVTFIENYDKDVLLEAINVRLLQETHPDIIEHISKSYAAEQLRQARIGRKHMEPDDTGAGKTQKQASDPALRNRVANYL